LRTYFLDKWYVNNNSKNIANRDLSGGKAPELKTRSNRTLVLLSSAAAATNTEFHLYANKT